MTGPPPPDANPWAVPAGQQPPTPATGPPPAYGPPPGYAQQPAYWPVYPSAQRPRRRWLPWVIVAALLTVGGCGALVATVGVHFYKQMDDAQTAVDDFLSAIERGDMAAADDVTLAGGIHHRDVMDVEYEHEQWLVCGVLSSDVRD